VSPLSDLTGLPKNAACGLERAIAARGAPVAVLDVTDQVARDIYGYDLILVRPDLHVVWRGNTVTEDAAQIATVATGYFHDPN